jgi:hypothetical protein
MMAKTGSCTRLARTLQFFGGAAHALIYWMCCTSLLAGGALKAPNLLAHAASVRDALPVPSFPLQFSARLTITAHLIEADSEYPPRTRSMNIHYDYLNKVARADIEAGYEAAKIYFRRYDLKTEYMVRTDPINDCKRSYMGELMPFPDIPDAAYKSVEAVNGINCHYFLYEEFDTRVHVYMDAQTGAPVKLVQESVSEATPLLSYDYTDVVLGQPADSLFELPKPYEHDKCVRHTGGFPYLHIYHHFVKF